MRGQNRNKKSDIEGRWRCVMNEHAWVEMIVEKGCFRQCARCGKIQYKDRSGRSDGVWVSEGKRVGSL